MAAQTTSSLSQEVMTFYEAKFLERAKHSLVHKEGAQMRTHKANSGKTIRFTRYSPLATVTTPLTEGNNPAEVNITASNVDATLAEYGNVVKVSKILSTVSIDREGTEKVELMGQNKGETLDEITRNELFAGATVQLAAGKSALSDISASDTLNATEVRKAVRTLKNNKAMRYPDGFFLAKISPSTAYDLMADNVWVNSKTYSDVKDLYAGEVGELHGARFLETTNPRTENSTVTVYSNFFHGANAFGCFDLEKDPPKLYIKIPGATDTSNPTDRYSTIGWAGSYVSKTLVSDWIINVKTAASS